MFRLENTLWSLLQKNVALGLTIQGFLGVMYANGQGVKQDYAKAVELYQKAAEQGDASAQYNLGIMYKNGLGVKQNYTKAKEYFGLACDNKDQDGCDMYKKLNQ